jgi:hypothetical protein
MPFLETGYVFQNLQYICFYSITFLHDNMKKICIISLIILFFQNYAIAQKGLNLEIQVSPGASMGGDFKVPVNLNSYPDYSYTNMEKELTFGINAGVGLSFFFTDKIGIGLDILYSRQGQNYKEFVWQEYGSRSTLQRDVSLNYLKLPFQFHFVSSPQHVVSFTLSAGFYIALLTGFNDEMTLTSSDASSYYNATLKATGDVFSGSAIYYDRVYGTTVSNSENAIFQTQPYNAVDVGGTMELGIQFKVSDRITLPLMVNYQIGFVDAVNNGSIIQYVNTNETDLFWPNYDFQAPVTYHNSFLGITTGVKINFGNNKKETK